MTPIRQLALGAVAGAALIAGLAIAPSSDKPATGAASLFDPLYQARALCTGRQATTGPAPIAAMSRIPWLKAAEKSEVPLWEGLGSLTYPVSTKSRLTQAYFDQGLKLSYGFNHAEAIRSYREAQRLDPNCALCYWGEAYAWGPNINLAMPDDAKAPAFAAIAKAVSLKGGAKAKEQALIDAMAKRYSDDPQAERAALDVAYAEAMKKVAATYPDDADIQTLYADALMNLRPWNYWQADGTAYADVADLVPTLERTMASAANHPGAIHLYIHAVEATNDPGRAVAPADRLADLMPAAGHLVHMPAHIYMRVGRHADSIRLNLKAAEADEAYIKAASATGVYPSGYYPHNVHFVLVSAQLAGDRALAEKTALKLNTLVADEVAKTAFWTQPVKASPWLTLAHIGAADAVLAQAKPTEEMPYLVAMWHYARGLAHDAKGDAAAAKRELAALTELSKAGGLMGYPQEYLPADTLGDIAIAVLRARIARTAGDLETAIKEYRAAADLQAKLPYTEPPFWYFPVKESLGATLLEAGKAAEAGDVFRASLLDQPGNAVALYGLMKAYEATGDAAGAAATKGHFESAWLGGEGRPDMKRL